MFDFWYLGGYFLKSVTLLLKSFGPNRPKAGFFQNSSSLTFGNHFKNTVFVMTNVFYESEIIKIFACGGLEGVATFYTSQ